MGPHKATVSIPEHLIGRKFELPYRPTKSIHAKEPSTLAIHRMFGFDDQAPDRAIILDCVAGHWRVTATERGEPTNVFALPFCQLVAALSYLEGHVLHDTLTRIKELGETGHAILAGIHRAATRKVMNVWDGDRNPYPWAGVGIIPVSPDGQEFAFARKDHLHPRFGYCGRLALIGGGMDPNEILSSWGDEAATARVAMLRECFEEIREIGIAHEIAEAAEYGGATAVRCYLYEHSGQATDGVVRTFVAQAPSAEAWDRWRRIFTPEHDGLGEALPALVNRKTLLAAIKQDDEAARAREDCLRETPAATIAEAAKTLVDQFSRQTGVSDEVWLRRREEGARDGSFPTQDRGDFNFISGAALAVRKALQITNLL